MSLISTVSKAYSSYNLYKLLTNTTTNNVSLSSVVTPWQPTQWKGLPSDEATLIGVKTGIFDSNNSNYYFFDAVFHETHVSSVRMTEHPVQTGANIVDHAYMMPLKLSLEIGMSDAMQSLVKTEWTGSYTKSVSAYQKLKELQSNRLPLTVHTRLNKYENMVIDTITVDDTYKTYAGLRATINMTQLLVAVIATVATSTDGQTTDSTNTGTVTATEV
jgi:hypothetical protein